MIDLHRPLRNFRLTAIDFISLREKLLHTEACSLESLRHPSRWTSLQFPSLFCQLPLDRFHLNPDGTFRFMGRRIFAEVYQTVSSMSWRTGTGYCVQGSLGSGKSHILAALACLLIKEGKKVVYLPDARVLARMMVVYTRAALQLTYSDNEELFQQIQAISSPAEILQFVHERSEEIYFICEIGRAHV